MPDEIAPPKDSVMIVSDHRGRHSILDGQRMSVRRKIRETRRDAAPRRRTPLDPASLILELDMAALVRRAGNSLRQHRDDAGGRKRSWWRRLLGKKRVAAPR